MLIKFRLPNDDVVEHTITESCTVEDLKQRICLSAKALKLGIEPSRMSFLLDNSPMGQSETFHGRGIKSGDVIDIVLKFNEVFLPSEVCYEPYIESISVSDGEQDVPVDVQPTFQFKENYNGLALFLPSFADRNSLPCDIDSEDMDVVLGEQEASKKGFVKWTDTVHLARMILLEVTNPHMRELSEGMRFNYFGINKGYAKADRHSWQRYSSKPPIPCYVYVDVSDQQVKLVPEESLDYGITYCIVLQNGMPTTPADSSVSLFSFTGRGVLEDKVILFRTARMKKSMGRASMFSGTT